MFKRFVHLAILYVIAFLPLRAAVDTYVIDSIDSKQEKNKDYREEQLKVDGKRFKITAFNYSDDNGSGIRVKGSFFISNESYLKSYENIGFTLMLERKESEFDTKITYSHPMCLGPRQIEKEIKFNLVFTGELQDVKKIKGHQFYIHKQYTKEFADFSTLCKANKKAIFITFLLVVVGFGISRISFLLYKRKNKSNKEEVKNEQESEMEEKIEDEA